MSEYIKQIAVNVRGNTQYYDLCNPEIEERLTKAESELNNLKDDLDVGNAVLVNKSTLEKISVKPENLDKYSSTKWEPIGVIVVPTSHNVYGTEECGIMSLKWMSCDTPTTGSFTPYYMYGAPSNSLDSLALHVSAPNMGWANDQKDVATGDSMSGHLPSDIFGQYQCRHDENAYYTDGYDYAFPSPYLTDNSRNEIYYMNLGWTNNFFSDFNGKGNSQKILSVRGSKESYWRPSNNVNDYPMVSCCDLYNTLGTNPGDWYLPAAGELGYLMTRLQKITNTINKLTIVFGQNYISSLTNQYIRSSTRQNGSSIIIFQFPSGSIGYSAVNGSPQDTIAFTRLNFGTSYKFYTKEEVDEKIDNVQVDLSDYYTKGEVDEKFIENPTNDHEYVDMGEAGIWTKYPIGLKNYNNGINGVLYFQWGDTQGYPDASEKRFDWNTYKFGGNGSGNQTKYNSIDGLTILEPEDDAATVNLGGSWRMPTLDDCERLNNLCDNKWVTNYKESGVDGRLFTLKSDTSKELFFPACGYYSNGVSYARGNTTSFWYSQLPTWTTYYAYHLLSNSGYFQIRNSNTRSYGYGVFGFIPEGTNLIKGPKYVTKKEHDEIAKDINDRIDSAINDAEEKINNVKEEVESVRTELSERINNVRDEVFESIEAGDIVLVNNDTLEKICISPNDLSKYKDTHTPIGIVAIPSSHYVYGTEESGIVSLAYMSCDTPDTGSSSQTMMYWGHDNNDTPLTNYNIVPLNGTSDGQSVKIIDTNTYSYIPSDKFTNIECIHDKNSKYYSNPASPSPYLSNGDRNPNYYFSGIIPPSEAVYGDLRPYTDEFSIRWETQTGEWTESENEESFDGKQFVSVSPGADGSTVIRCTFSGTEGQITFSCLSEGQSSYDYLTIGKLDTPCTRTSYGTSLKGMAKKVQLLTFETPDEEEHFVEFCYSKNGTTDTAPDCATVFVMTGDYEPLLSPYRDAIDCTKNALSDLDGKANTNVLWSLATSQEDWRTSNGHDAIPAETEEVFTSTNLEINWSTQSGTWNESAVEEALDGKKFTCVSPGSNGSTVIRCTFRGNSGDKIIFSCLSQGESGYDYLTIGNLDSTCSRNTFKETLKDKAKTLTNFVFTVNDDSEHFVEFCYSKDSSQDIQPDNAEVFIAKSATVITVPAVPAIPPIENNSSVGYFPAACTCWRFHTKGTNQGDWYLPSEGELGYMMARYQKIQDAITTIKEVGFEGIEVSSLGSSDAYQSSTESASLHAWSIDTRTGYTIDSSKSSLFSIRAFTRLRVNKPKFYTKDEVDTHPIILGNNTLISHINNDFYEQKLEAGNIVLVNNNTQEKFVCPIDKVKYYTRLYTPIGIIVIPESHDVYGTGEAAVMSLASMSSTDPANGTDTNVGVSTGTWGNKLAMTSFGKVSSYGTDISNIQTTLQSPTNKGYGASDNYDGVIYPNNPNLKYVINEVPNDYGFCPSPYSVDGSRNPDYYDTTISTTSNALSDFSGITSTDIVATDAKGRGAQLTRLFSPIGTKPGDWYLPSVGELGYLHPNLKLINSIIEQLKELYGSRIMICTLDGNIQSSTEANYAEMWYVGLTSGAYYYYSKNYSPPVRAFMRIKLSELQNDTRFYTKKEVDDKLNDLIEISEEELDEILNS